MHVLIAPNAFKHGLDAEAAAQAIAAGLADSAFAGTWALCPVGDGGDGTAALLVRRLGGREVRTAVHDPLGRLIDSRWVLLKDDKTAVIELADASGLRLLSAGELNPLRATTCGTGELLRHALDHGAREILLCIGGSATVDGAAGLLRALGVEFLDGDGRSITAIPEGLRDLAQVSLQRLDPRLGECRVMVLCDVDNPLLGPRGAAAVFGPQKGADAAAMVTLESALARFADQVNAATGRRIDQLVGGGAAGGVAAGLFGMLGATLTPGADYFLDRIDFASALQGADVVITGEGRIDEQTVHGKAPWAVALRAKARGALVIGLAGQVPAVVGPDLRSGFDVLMSIGTGSVTPAEAIRHTAASLRRTAHEVGNLLQWVSRRPL